MLVLEDDSSIIPFIVLYFDQIEVFFFSTERIVQM